MKIRELFETDILVAYHVTFTDHVPKIMKQGIKPLQTSNWTKRGGDAESRYNEEGGIFAFADPEDAFKWAFKQQFDFSKSVSIIKINRSNVWGEDPSVDVTLNMGKGDALRTMGSVPPSDIIGIFPFDDFGTPMSLKVSQEEWIRNSLNKMTK